MVVRKSNEIDVRKRFAGKPKFERGSNRETRGPVWDRLGSA